MKAKGAGLSCTHEDFQAPPLADLELSRAAYNVQAPLVKPVQQIPLEHQSTTHADYPPHATEALRDGQASNMLHQDASQSALWAGTRFEGESSAHRDYPAPPLEALRHMLEGHQPTKERMHGAVRFEGLSSMREDYQAPPITAFALPEGKRMVENTGVLHHGPPGASVKESTAHHDFQAPPLQDLRPVADRLHHDERRDAPPPFDAESTTHSHYKPPPCPSPTIRPADKQIEVQHLLAPDVQEPGQSTTHSDYQAPPLAAMAQLKPAVEQNRQSFERTRFEGQSTMHADYPPHMTEALRDGQASIMLHQDSAIQSALWAGTRFEGESSAHRDYPAPPLEALRHMLEGHQPTKERMHGAVRFEGLSSMREDYQTPPLESLRQWLRAGHTPEPARNELHKFEGESTQHRDFQAPPLQSLHDWLRSTENDAAASQEIVESHFEGESSMKAHYQARADQVQ